jgi:hypothetical protein
MELPKDLKDEIWEYCRLNDITDLNAFMVRMLKQGYNIEKYGATPFKMGQKEPEIIEKEIIREVIVEKEVIKEVIVEKEKIVEVIKEVPVEVIKEIIVEKIGGITENRVEVPVEVIKEVEKIVEVEKIIEVPVEIIKNVERIVEVPVEVERIVQVPVETVLTKVEYVSDKSGESELLLKIQQLESDKQLFSTITIEMENNFQNEMSKKDKELDELRRNLDEKDKTEKLKLLQETLQTLRGEIQQKNEQIKELEKINRDLLNGNQNQAYLLRGSNLNRRI